MGLPNILPQLPGVSNLVNNIVARNVLPSTPSGPWYPPQWSNAPAMVSITATLQGGSTTTELSSSLPNGLGPSTQSLTTPLPSVSLPTYVFDAVLSLEHDQRLVKTQHPVQTGASISSHAYLMPAQLVLYVGMSDAMQAYAAGIWAGNASKSVSAYQTMLSLQAARIPLTVVTRLRTYNNMIITSVAPREDSKTITGLRMRVELEEIFTASTALSPTSARSNDTASTGLGAVNPVPLSTTAVSQFMSSAGVVSSFSGPQGVSGPGSADVLTLAAAGFK